MKNNILEKVRPNILALKPYSSARDEFKGAASVFLDANENAYGSPSAEAFNRYPDPLQWQLKFQLARIKGVPAENIFIGNGSDEAIDLAYRIFCRPGIDNVIICPPTYGMYEVSANINDVETRKVLMLSGFQLDVDGILERIDDKTRLIFICSPNNPTGNCVNRADILTILNNFDGLVIIDEAYINFAPQKSFIAELTDYANLLVLQTLSKAWGMAALRVGMAFGSLALIDLFNKVKPPYNINLASQEIALAALQHTDMVNNWIREIVLERNRVAHALTKLHAVLEVFPSDANFLLVKFTEPVIMYTYLADAGIVVRNRSKEPLCEGCLRITIGTPEENNTLIKICSAYASA